MRIKVPGGVPWSIARELRKFKMPEMTPNEVSATPVGNSSEARVKSRK
jgi:hypothetical protein